MDLAQLVRGLLFLASLLVVTVLVYGIDASARLVGLEVPSQLAQERMGGQVAVAGDAKRAAGTDRPEAAEPTPTGVTTFTYPVGSEAHSGALFVPAPGPRPYPVLIVLDYWSANEVVVKQWLVAAAAEGWLVVTTKHVYRGSSEAHDRAEYSSLLGYLQRNHSIDRERVVITGFSAAGVGAYDLALGNADLFAGAIPQGVHGDAWARRTSFTRKRLKFYMFAAESDFNVAPTRALGNAMRDRGYEVTFGTGPGGHRAIRSAEQAGALRFFGHTEVSGTPTQL